MVMKDYRSIIIISFYALMNSAIIWIAFSQQVLTLDATKKPGSMAPEFTIIETLEYFHLKNGIAQMSLSADNMKSQGEELAEFFNPRGIYNYQQRNETLRYEAVEADYKKAKDLLTLKGDVKVTSSEAIYKAQKVKYYLKKDLMIGTGGVDFQGEDLKSKDHLSVTSDSMRANPQSQYSRFQGNVKGTMQRKKKYEGKTTFSSADMTVEGDKSLAHLEGDVVMNRENYVITSGKADMYLENFNKSLKYFVLNDDVKMTETLNTPQGVTQRKAFAERLEGFGREEKMVLTGAPRVEMGTDVIKGYKITIRENVDLIEVDDSMSDVQMKRKKTKE
jgi:lipopolysaccharide export system protein LptA